MRDFPPCSGHSVTQIADCYQSKPYRCPQNLVTCVYRSKLRSKSCLISITWSYNLIGQILTVGIDDSFVDCLCKLHVKPWPFTRKRECKSMESNSCKIDIHWDLSSAKFGAGPEPIAEFYVGVVVDRRMILLLGDRRQEALKKTNSWPATSDAILVSKTEHVFGKNTFSTRAKFYDSGRSHDLVIECGGSAIDGGSRSLRIRVDGKAMVQVEQLQWKFRGNCSIFVEGLAVEVCWDVHNWFFGGCLGDAVFLFRTLASANQFYGSRSLRVIEQPWESSQGFSEFSLILHAWKID